MKKLTILTLLMLGSLTMLRAQQTGEAGGEAPLQNARTHNGKYGRYVTEYKRKDPVYMGDGTFEDYFPEGQK